MSAADFPLPSSLTNYSSIHSSPSRSRKREECGSGLYSSSPPTLDTMLSFAAVRKFKVPRRSSPSKTASAGCLHNIRGAKEVRATVGAVHALEFVS